MLHLECKEGPHEWEFAGRGQRRCAHCGRFGFIPQIRTGYKTKKAMKHFRSPADSQGVRLHLCQVPNCDEPAYGKDDVSYRKKEWRCSEHRASLD